MNSPLRQFEPRRAGFTLVELLVAISIFVVLATLTIGAWQQTSDRVGASLSTFKNALEGARSRAINSGEIRGLRLIPDPNDPRIVTSLVYVGAPQFVEGEVWFVNGANDHVVNQGPTAWKPLIDRGLLNKGSRIELPANSGNWFVITRISGINDNTIWFSGFYNPSRWDSSANDWEGLPQSPQRLAYRIELQPTILAGAEPILLEPGTCIDLDGCKLPSGWRRLEDSNLNRRLDGTETDLNGNGQFDFSADYRAGPMDILFGPTGLLAGSIVAEGILHFRMAEVDDVVLAQPMRTRPLNGNFNGVPTYLQGFITPADPTKDHEALSLFTQTGNVVVSVINPTILGTETTGFNNDIAVSPFLYAVRGQEAN